MRFFDNKKRIVFNVIKRVVVMACLCVSPTLTSNEVPASRVEGAQIASDEDKYLEKLIWVNKIIGRTLDGYYQAFGNRIDIAYFDLIELKAQRKEPPQEQINKITRAQSEIMTAWKALELRRLKLDLAITQRPEKGKFEVIIENTTPVGTGISSPAWVAIKCAEIMFDGGGITYPAGQFYGGQTVASLIGSTAAIIHPGGVMSTLTGSADAIEIPQDARLRLTACSDGGKICPDIRITINGLEIFKGRCPFEAEKWSTQDIRIPAAAFRKFSSLGCDSVALDSYLIELQADIANFGQMANDLADEIDGATWKARETLVYRPDESKSNFIRGLCLFLGFKAKPKCGTTRETKLYEYEIKSFTKELGIQCSYVMCIYDSSIMNHAPDLMKQLGVKGMWRLWNIPASAEMLSSCLARQDYFSDPERAIADTKIYLRKLDPEHKFAGIEMDEPYIRDEANFLRNPKVIKAFCDYLGGRREYLAEFGISIDANATPEFAHEADNIPLWMEWQQFKKKYHYDYLKTYSDAIAELGYCSAFGILPRLHTFPQESSAVELFKLPLFETDPYYNARVMEGVFANLARNTAKGVAMFTPGAGWASHSPDRFRRSMALGMIHCDGVMEWSDLYLMKYREPNQFFRGYGIEKNHLGMFFRQLWRPEYWEITKDMYNKMKVVDDYLVNKNTSASPVALLLSERTAMVETKSEKQYWLINNHFRENEGLYAQLMQSGRSIDLIYVDALKDLDISKYKMIFMSDIKCIASAEADILRQWVTNGGVLVATGNSSLFDEWGRKRSNYAFNDVFGVNYISGGAIGKVMSDGENEIKYHDFTYAKVKGNYELNEAKDFGVPNFSYVKGKVNPLVKVTYRWENGDPALTINNFGKGKAYFFSMEKLGTMIPDTQPRSSGFQSYYPSGEGIPGVKKLLGDILDKECVTGIVTVGNAPFGVEVQVRQVGDDIVLHLLDWMDNRLVDKLQLTLNSPGKYTVLYPFENKAGTLITQEKPVEIEPFHLYNMLVLKKK